ncbi:unnamed protein product, partial [Closterium sp. NIES-53]
MWRLSRAGFRSPCHAPYRLSEPLKAAAGETWTRITASVTDAPYILRNIRLVSSGLRESTSASPSAPKACITPSDIAAGKPPDASSHGSSTSTLKDGSDTANGVKQSSGDSTGMRSSSSNNGSSGGEVFDVAIVGGGLIGAAAACALSTSRLTSGLRIALIDALPLSQALRHASHSSSTPSVGAMQISAPDARVIAVNPSSIDLLK